MKKLDSTTLTSIAAEKAGMSYGKYVALYGVVTEEDPEIIAEALPNVPLCVECGKPILHRAGRQKYCSDECMRRAGRRRCVERYRKRRKEEAGERICEVCGKPIPSERNLQSKTCSEECSEELHRINKNRRRMEKRGAKEVNEDT